MLVEFLKLNKMRLTDAFYATVTWFSPLGRISLASCSWDFHSINSSSARGKPNTPAVHSGLITSNTYTPHLGLRWLRSLITPALCLRWHDHKWTVSSLSVHNWRNKESPLPVISLSWILYFLISGFDSFSAFLIFCPVCAPECLCFDPCSLWWLWVLDCPS